MTVPNAQDNALLGTYPQQTKNWLSIYKPSIALQCQVSGSYSAANQTVGFDNVTSGSYTNITDYMFQVALVGTSVGSEDIGRTWVRSATNGTLRFVESDHINWQNNLYITVLNYTEIIPVFPRIIQNPADEEDVIFYKIWDVAYTNQNSILGTLINMGSHYAGFGNQVYWSASGTWNVLDENVTYLWDFQGGTPTGSVANTPGYVTYPGPGHYRTTLTVTSASGAVDKSVRYVSLYNRPGEGGSLPYLDWSRSEYAGSQDGRGYSCRIKLSDPIPEDTVLDGALVVIFKDDWYGDQQLSVSNNGLGRSNISMVGYIEGGTIEYNYSDGSIEFTVVSPTKIMELCEGFSISVENNLSPSKWYELYAMTVKRAMYHYMRWQSSILLCTDVAMSFTDKDVQYFDADRTSLYDALYQFVNGTLYGNIVSDKLGKIWMFQEPGATNNAATTLPIASTITKSMWAGQPIITERQYNDTCFIELGGIAYDNLTNQSTALLGSAPGTSPAYHGRVDKKQGLALDDQTDLNNLVGNLYAFRNSRYPDVQLKMRGNFANFDIAPPEQVLLNVLPDDTPRRVTWTNKPFAITGVSWEWDAKQQLERPMLTLAEITDGYAGATISIPIEPPDTATPEGGGCYTQPPFSTPIIPAANVGLPGTLDIYHNGTFVMSANALNFIGQIVYVEQNPTNSNMADIYFDACGCSGSFLGEHVGDVWGAFGLLDWMPEAWATPTHYWAEVEAPNFENQGDSDEIVSVTGSYTFRVPYTGQYTFSWSRIDFACEGVGSFTIDYNIKMHMASYTKEWSGTANGVAGLCTANLGSGSADMYLIEGQEIIIGFEKSCTVTSGSDPTIWGMGTASKSAFYVKLARKT